MSFIKFVSGLEIFLQGLVIAMFVFLFAVVFFWLLKIRRNSIKEKEKFHAFLLKGLKVGSINSNDDIFNLYKGISGDSLPNDSYRNLVNELLVAFIVKIHEEGMDIKDEEIIEWTSIITELIKKSEEVSPFSSLPDAERNIMNDLLIFLEDDKKDSAKTKIRELAGYVQSKDERLIDLEKKHKSASVAAYTGLSITVLSVIMSIIMSLK